MMQDKKSGANKALLNKSPEGDKSVVDEARRDADSASVSSRGRGLSNTPAPWGYNCSIDYLKIRFDREFNPVDEDFGDLFKILKLNIYGFIQKGGMSGYDTTYMYDESVFVSTGGDYTKNAAGDPTSILEMKGHACRLFEDRVIQDGDFFENYAMAQFAYQSAWRNLFHQIEKMGGHCTRIDLPVDDLSGKVPLEELRDKVYNKEFTTNLRAFSLDDDLPRHADHTRVKEGKYEGFTATFGGTDKTQLCIYNKAAERLAHGGTVNTNFWVRYEVRYFHKVAEEALTNLIDYFDNGKFFEFCMRCLSGVICFKDLGNWDPKDVRHAPTWDKWAAFLREVGGLAFGSRDLNASTLQSQGQWLLRSASKAIARIVFVFKDHAIDVLKYIANEGAGALELEDIAIVDNYLKTQKRKPIGYLNGIIDGVKEFCGDTNNLDPMVKRFFMMMEVQERKPSVSAENIDGDAVNPFED